MAEVDVVVLDDDSRDRIGLRLFVEHERFAADVGFGTVSRRVDDDTAAIDADAAALADGFRIDVARRVRCVVDDFRTRIEVLALAGKGDACEFAVCAFAWRILMG